MIVENGIVTDPEQVGFYSGFIESLFSLMSFLAGESTRLFSLASSFSFVIFRSYAVHVHVRSFRSKASHSIWYGRVINFYRSLRNGEVVLVYDCHALHRWNARWGFCVST